MLYNLFFVLTCLCIAYLSGARSGMIFLWFIPLLLIKFVNLSTYSLAGIFLILFVVCVRIMQKGTYGDTWGEKDV